jgi:mono/diheme cytochrome c family protein
VRSTKYFFRLILFPLGLALLLAATLFQEGTALLQTTPTPDRLAEPTLPVSPSQADIGAQAYWLSCLPCHGDIGQGLTDEFRLTYPEEERNCWTSGCHGQKPYEDGFTFPKYIPPIIGSGTLQKFSNAAILRSYIFATMPFWKPGSLTEEETWQITAFLLRENKLWDAQDELNASNADRILVAPPQATPTPQPPADTSSAFSPIPLFISFTVLFFLLIFWRSRKNKARS